MAWLGEPLLGLATQDCEAQVKFIIIIVGIVVALAGAAASFNNRNLFIKAALYDEAFSLSLEAKAAVENSYEQRRVLPHDNEQAQLPPPHTMFGTSIKQIAVVRDGVVLVRFKEELGNANLSFTPVFEQDDIISWTCASDSIDESVLEKMRPACTHLPSTAESLLMDAIARQDLKSVREQIIAGVDLEMVIAGNTPMMLAAKMGNAEVVSRLLESGAAVDHARANSERRTPLMVAITSGHAEIVAVLLSEGASIQRRDYRLKTAVDYAREVDDRNGGDHFSLLLAAQMNPLFGASATDVKLGLAAAYSTKSTMGMLDEQRRTTLTQIYEQFDYAVTNCNVKRIESILRANNEYQNGDLVDGKPLHTQILKPECQHSLTAFVESKNSWQRSFVGALEAALQSCDVDETRTMMQQHSASGLQANSLSLQSLPMQDKVLGHLAFNVRDSLLFTAIQSGCTDAVNLFMREANIHEKLDSSVLMMAVKEAPQHVMLRIIRVLIHAGANVNGPDERGQTPLLTAISFEQPVIAKFLVDAGADVNRATSNGSWPLIEATQKGYYHLVQQLISSGAEINAQDELGRTALHAAVAKGTQRIVAALMNAGANHRISDKHGINPILIASTTKQAHIEALLVSQ